MTDAAGVVGGVAERPGNHICIVHGKSRRVVVQINMDFNGEPTVDRKTEVGVAAVDGDVAGAAVVKEALEGPLHARIVVVLQVKISAAARGGNIILEVDVEHTGGLVGKTVDNVVCPCDFQGVAGTAGLLVGDVSIFRRAGRIAPGGPVGVVLRAEALPRRVTVEVVGIDNRLCLKHHAGECQAEKK